MKIFYWIKTNLGKLFFIILVAIAIYSIISNFFITSDQQDNSNSNKRPSIINLRPQRKLKYRTKKRFSNKKRRPLNPQKIIKKPKRKVEDNIQEISSKTQQQIISLQKDLAKHGVEMLDIVEILENYFLSNPKKEMSKEDLIKILPPYMKKYLNKKRKKQKIKTKKGKSKKRRKIKKREDEENDQENYQENNREDDQENYQEDDQENYKNKRDNNSQEENSSPDNNQENLPNENEAEDSLD